MSVHRVAALQMVGGPDLERNLERARGLIERAARAGAGLAVLPEVFACVDLGQSRELGAAERDSNGPIRDFLRAMAREHGIALVGGTVPVAEGGGLPRAACLLVDADGEERARYDKMHLFDVDLPDARREYRESAYFSAGDEVVTVPMAFGLLGLAVCYDLRFPELFRVQFQRGMRVLALPSAFTRLTGEAHWHVLVRARAIENQCFVIAANQGGRHSPLRESYGGSLIVDPWGRVLASAATGEAVLLADIDTAVLEDVRRRLPTAAHQRLRLPDAG